MTLSDLTKENAELALASHQYCRHSDPVLCHMLILSEIAMREQRGLDMDEEVEEIGKFIADRVLESLILKGIVEMSGMDENGQMTVSLTEEGQAYSDDKWGENEDEGNDVG